MNFRPRLLRECCLLSALLAAFGLAPIQGAPTTSSEPASSAYTNQSSNTSSPAYDPGPSFSSSSSFSNSAFSNTNYNYRPLYTRFFFPPTPPVLGEKIPYRSSVFSTARMTSISNQAAPYVGEVFYSPLATHLSREEVTKKQHRRLDAYQVTRKDLLTELEAKLENLRNAPPVDRERELSAFARQQAARIDALEQEAEDLRAEMIDGSFVQSPVGWSEWDNNRTWRLGDDLRYESRVDEFKVVRAAAQFYPYLTPGQRRLLQELALELNEPLADPSSTGALDSSLSLFHFSPETARVRLPADLPESVTGKISAYQTEKAALKSELRAAIYQVDRSFFYFTRKNVLVPLAERQTSRIAALDTMAEDIRRELAAIPNSNRPKRVDGSNEFARRMIALSQARSELFRALEEKMAAVKKMFPTARVELQRSASAYIIQLTPNLREGRSEKKKIAAYQAELAQFNREKAAQHDTLLAQKNAINAEGLNFARGVNLSDPNGRARMRELVDEFRQHEHWELYRLYDSAVFEPGLSPGQRRLLFAAALRKLDLPIPAGSTQP